MRCLQSVYCSLILGFSHLLQGRVQAFRRSCHVLQRESLGISRYLCFNVVTDIWEKLLNTEESYNVSAIKSIHACARSVFILDRADLNDGYKDGIIHYGQKLRIRINPLLIDKPIYLYSEPASVNRYSKVSRLQEVIMMLKNNHSTVWALEHPDPNERLEMVGSPVRADDSILLKH